MPTPWGRSDSTTKYAEGVYDVNTPSHGGILIAKSVAAKLLTPAAIKRGESFGHFLAYEEDCAWNIVAFERPELFPQEHKTRNAILFYGDGIFHSLSRWYADYLLELGIEPAEPFYADWRAHQLDSQMRREHHPNLIISAIGKCSWVTIPDDSIQVTTADGTEHLITRASYHITTPNLLSNCQLYAS